MTQHTEGAVSARNIFIALGLFTLIVIVAVTLWGAVALAMAALVLVPVVFALLLAVTRQ
ncbi:hypothetical protein [Pseudorhodobacter turbinis]|uniref:hypothetical protein n=1 Tax=Pseudorhodobacter turbinis TaxID=2500533 RepID=UPI00143D5F90|nr:hypothetical protein [Pseudorhodobacter turbinis]